MRIIYLDLDCIRNDHLGCYGYHRNTSPHIDELAEGAVRFTHCFASNTPCLPSRAALFSGRFGVNNGVVSNSEPSDQFGYPDYGGYPSYQGRRERDQEMPMLARHLRVHGIKTVSFSNFADRHDAWWFHAGWAEFHTVNLRRGFETADEVNAVLLPWLEEHAAEDNYFLHINYWDIHFPYRVPDMPKWMALFEDVPAPEWPDEETIRHQYANTYGPRSARDLWGFGGKTRYPWMPDQVSTREEFEQLINGYDGSIYYTDHYIAQVLDVLRRKGVLEDTVFIISGDHGDAFGEGGLYMDHYMANEPVCKRPLIIRVPGMTKTGSCDALIYQLDLAPTLCDLLEVPVPARWDGLSFVDALRGEAIAGREYLVLDQGIATAQRGVRTRNHFFVRTLHPGFYRIDEPYELYEIERDPYMTTDIAPQHPELVEKHDHLIYQWLAEQPAGSRSSPADPMELLAGGTEGSADQVRRTISRLQSLGRETEAEEILARLRRYHPAL